MPASSIKINITSIEWLPTKNYLIFLESIERRTFKQTIYAVHNEESALDIVHDAMIKLAEKYGDRPAIESPLLFQRIFQNTVLDFFRREKVRNTWISLFSNMISRWEGNDDFDMLDTFEAEEGSEAAESSLDKVEREQLLNLLDAEIQKLPTRQREALLMRYWEDMDVAETAIAMGCSGGSAKTHYPQSNFLTCKIIKNTRNSIMKTGATQSRSAISANELEFAYKVRRALDEQIENMARKRHLPLKHSTQNSYQAQKIRTNYRNNINPDHSSAGRFFSTTLGHGGNPLNHVSKWLVFADKFHRMTPDEQKRA